MEGSMTALDNELRSVVMPGRVFYAKLVGAPSYTLRFSINNWDDTTRLAESLVKWSMITTNTKMEIWEDGYENLKGDLEIKYVPIASTNDLELDMVLELDNIEMECSERYLHRWIESIKFTDGKDREYRHIKFYLSKEDIRASYHLGDNKLDATTIITMLNVILNKTDFKPKSLTSVLELKAGLKVVEELANYELVEIANKIYSQNKEEK